MTVSNPATLSSVKANFGGPGNLAAYVRGGSYVPIGGPSSISTTVSGLALSQFNGVSPYTPISISNATNVYGVISSKGTFNLGGSTVTYSGGNGSATATCAYVSGSTAIQGARFNATAWNFTGTSTSPTGLNAIATWRWTVSDGVSSATWDITVESTNGV